MNFSVYEEKIIEALDEISDVCRRCKFRFAGIKNSKIHLKVGSESSEPEPPPASKVSRSNPCRACIGVLQDHFMEPALDTVSDDIRKSGYDADHFTIAISLPVSLTLRHHSFCIYLQEKVEEFYDNEVIPIKQVWKWIFPNKLTDKIGKKYVTGESCEFYADLQINYEEDEAEMKAISQMCEKEYAMREQKSRKYHMGLVTRQGIEKSLEKVSMKKFREHYSIPPSLPSKFTSSVTMNHNSIFIAGRYNKYSRELPQTPWIVDGERKMSETSVKEIILDQIQTSFQFDSARFSSSGREDVDVRTLGRGRPFLFEILNSRKTHFTKDEFKEIQKKINSSSEAVRVRDLQLVSKDQIKMLKEGEDQKMKTYTAICVIPNGNFDFEKVQKILEGQEAIILDQMTPIRVLHRRPNAVRKRSVYDMKVFRTKSLKNEGKPKFRLSLKTQAGTYVKEFIHGDFQRTRPNLKTILRCDVDIEALDVESIELDWPPSLEN